MKEKITKDTDQSSSQIPATGGTSDGDTSDMGRDPFGLNQRRDPTERNAGLLHSEERAPAENPFDRELDRDAPEEK